MKLYWRVKINGKWTWRPAEVHLRLDTEDIDTDALVVLRYQSRVEEE